MAGCDDTVTRGALNLSGRAHRSTLRLNGELAEKRSHAGAREKQTPQKRCGAAYESA
jgi:hypothetical protein